MNDGVKLAEQHDYAKAAIELRNALRLKNNMLPAWRRLAQVEETTQQLGRRNSKPAINREPRSKGY